MMTFQDCCAQCIANKALVSEFNRLSGCHLGEKRTPIQMVIDTACNYDQDMDAMPKFVDFVCEFVWKPLLLRTGHSY